MGGRGVSSEQDVKAETWWEVNAYSPTKINPVQVTRSTGVSVWVITRDWHDEEYVRRYARRSSSGGFFPTWEEAKGYALDVAEKKAASYRRALEQANGTLGNVKGLKKPEGV